MIVNRIKNYLAFLTVSIFTEQMLELHRGQGMEIFWRDSFHCPTEEEYNQMTIRKTGKTVRFTFPNFFGDTSRGPFRAQTCIPKMYPIFWGDTSEKCLGSPFQTFFRIHLGALLGPKPVSQKCILFFGDTFVNFLGSSRPRKSGPFSTPKS